MSEWSIKEELKVKRFRLDHPHPECFAKSQWTDSRWVYIAWRVFWCVFHIALLIASGVDYGVSSSEDGGTWFVSLIHWTLLLTTLTCVLDLINAFHNRNSEHNSFNDPPSTAQSSTNEKDEIIFHAEFILVEGIKQRSLPWFVKLIWLLYSVTNSLNIVCMVVYWAVEFDESSRAVESVTNIANIVFALSNVLFTAMPVQVLHFIYPCIYSTIYIIFTVIYQACGGSKHVFPGIDWGHAFPTWLVIVLGLLLVVPVCHLVTFALYTFRVYLFSLLHSSSYSPSNQNAMASVHYINRDPNDGELSSRVSNDNRVEISEEGNRTGIQNSSQMSEEQNNIERDNAIRDSV